MNPSRIVALILIWAGLTTLAAVFIGPRQHHVPGPLRVIAIEPAHADTPPPNRPEDIEHLAKVILLDELAKVPPTTTTTRPVVRRPVSRSTAGVEQWRSLVAQYPWPVDTMLTIMRCESGGDPSARNSSGASGLFQLNPGPSGWEDPAFNIRYAYEHKYVPSGLSPWNASRSCWG